MPLVQGTAVSGVYGNGVAITTRSWKYGTDAKRKRLSGFDLIAAQTPHSAWTWTQHRGASRSDANVPSTVAAGDFTSDNPTITRAFNEALISLLNKTKEQSINLAVFCGEYRETASMFVGIADRCIRAHKALRRGRLGDAYNAVLGYRPDLFSSWTARRKREYRLSMQASRAARMAGNHHLAIRYGLTPLVFDLEAGMDEIFRSDFFRDGSAIFDVQATRDYRYNAYTPLREGRSSLYQESTGQVKLKLYYKVTPTFDAAKRWGLTNPIAAAYELTALSFVLDWFIPVGEFLSTLDSLVGTSVLAKYRTTTGSKFEERQMWPFNGAPDTKSWYRRSEYSRTPTFNLTPAFPSWKPSPSFSRIVDALSLSYQAFGKPDKRVLPRR